MRIWLCGAENTLEISTLTPVESNRPAQPQLWQWFLMSRMR